nr:type II toxin-antitoxin system VapC family toxin [uncultured Desulfuromonas sp.]
MNFLVDTCVVSELVKAQPNPKVVEWIDAVDEGRIFLSVLTLGELEKGIAKLQNVPRKDALREWLEHDLIERFAGKILPIDEAVAVAWGRMQGEAEQKGNKLPVIDSLLAATAEINGLTVATRNVVDFERCGCRLFNPWAS